MNVLMVIALLVVLLILGLPTLQQTISNLRELARLSKRSAGDIVKTIDLSRSSSAR